ncbi:hypothetical protein NSA19_00005 [Actinomyces bowdenii]|uniref:hypothetical protein n=1 Tax=Actinomyces bowdenii TaxID=131109 RepID=UPI00214BE100|nr:hypothetical protein [Actinomyces bowdenii]MCR2051262.1 hypothetical protein [Actinomyces bowdenii]
MKKAAARQASPAPEKGGKRRKILVGVVLVVLLAMISQCGGGGRAPDDSPTVPSVPTAVATAAAAAEAVPTAAPDTAGTVVNQMQCDSKVLTSDEMVGNAAVPLWAGDNYSSVAGCQYNGWTAVVVVEYASEGEALQAVARAQESEGWKNRVTVDGRFARGASGADWSAVDFPEITQ